MDKTIYSKISDLYEKNTKDTFENFKSNELVALKKKTYDKYFHSSLALLGEIDIPKIEADCTNLENEISKRISQIKDLEQHVVTLTELSQDSQIKIDDLTDLQGFPLSQSETCQGIVEKVLHSAATIERKTNTLGQKLENLYNEPLDSIKKAKRDYEKNNDGLIKTLRFALAEKRGMLSAVLEEKENKVKALEEKKMTSAENEKKIEKLTKEYNDNNERMKRETKANEDLQQEIDDFEGKVSSLKNEIQASEKNLLVKKGSKGMIHSIGNIHDQELKDLIKQNRNLSREVELYQMQQIEYSSYLKLHSILEKKISSSRDDSIKFLSVCALIMVIKKKITRCKDEIAQLEGLGHLMSQKLVSALDHMGEDQQALKEEIEKCEKMSKEIDRLRQREFKYKK